jgi:hypothetical protein
MSSKSTSEGSQSINGGRGEKPIVALTPIKRRDHDSDDEQQQVDPKYTKINEEEKEDNEIRKIARLQQMREYSRNKRMSTEMRASENAIRRHIYNNSTEKADQIKARNRESYQKSPEKADQIKEQKRESYHNSPEKADQIKVRSRDNKQRRREFHAKNIYSAISTNIPEARELVSFESNIETALALFWERSGIYRFRENFYSANIESDYLSDTDTDINDNDEEYLDVKYDIKKELKKHVIDDNVLQHCITGYNKKMSPFEIEISYCSVCNIRQFESKDKYAINADSLPDLLLVPKTAVDNYYNVPSYYRPAFNVYEWATKLYYLNPSLCFADAEGTIKFPVCEDCKTHLLDKGSLPVYSIANGFDFGDATRIGLPVLTLLEKAVLSRCHLYAQIIKLVPARGFGDETYHTALKGHILLLDHDGPEQISKSLINCDIQQFVSISFVGTLEQWDIIKMRWKTHSTLRDKLLLNVSSIQRWLYAFQYLKNPQYADINCFELNASDIEYLQSLSESIIKNAEIIDDEIAVSVERHSGSSSSNLLPDSDTIDNGRNALDFVRITNRFHKVPENTNANLIAIRNAFPEQIRNITVSRSSIPNNEFLQNDKILLRTFPWLFLFGKLFFYLK